MKTCETKLRAVLDETERKLLTLIADCASDGDLNGVDAVRRATMQVRAIAESSQETSVQNDDGIGDEMSAKRRKRKKVPSKSASRYPQFEIRNSTLYRIGWSRKKKEQYEHKVPKDTVDQVVNAMATMAGNQRPFTTEQIISRANQQASVLVPTYQVYAVIGWLRAQQLTEQMGREGYQVSEDFKAKVSASWANVIAKHNKRG